jgi:hypothetical protein
MFDTVFTLFQNFCLFAQRSAPKKLGGAIDMNSVTMIILGAAIVAAVAVIAYYIGSNLRKTALDKEKPLSLSDHLAAFREASDDGSMTAAEFAAIKKHLAQKIMDEVKQDDSPNDLDNNLPKFIPR